MSTEHAATKTGNLQLGLEIDKTQARQCFFTIIRSRMNIFLTQQYRLAHSIAEEAGCDFEYDEFIEAATALLNTSTEKTSTN